MATFKLILFGITVLLFVSVLIAFFENDSPRTGVSDIIVPAFFLLSSIILGIIILIVLGVSSDLSSSYLKIFLVFLIPLGLYTLVSIATSVQENYQRKIENKIIDEAYVVFEEAEKLLDKPIEADKLLQSVKSEHYYVVRGKAVVYLQLFLKNRLYKDEMISLLDSQNMRMIYFLRDYIRSHKLENEDECLALFELNDKNDKLYFLDSSIEEKLGFKTLVKRKFYKAAIRSLDFGSYIEEYLKMAEKIEDEVYRKQAILMIEASKK